MSKHAIELCVHLVEHLFGALPSRTLATLFLYGRLSFTDLLHHIDLTPYQLRHSLAVLVQEHFVFWYKPDEGAETQYEADPLVCYSLIRLGKHESIVDDRFGALASKIVAQLLQLGHAKVGELVLICKDQSCEAPKGLPNGHQESSPPILCNGKTAEPMEDEAIPRASSAEAVYKTLSDLLSYGLLVKANKFQLYPHADRRIEAENRGPPQSNIAVKMKKKEAEEYEQMMNEQLMAWKHGIDLKKEEEEEEALIPKGKKKRSLENGDSNPEPKRAKLCNGNHNSGDRQLSDDLVLRVSHEKLTVMERSSRLAEFARSSIGPVTSRVYSKVLQALEKDTPECTGGPTILDIVVDEDKRVNPEDLPQLRTDGVRRMFHNDAELAEYIGHAQKSRLSMRHSDHRKKHRRKNEGALVHGDVTMTNGDHDEQAEVDGQASSDESEDSEDDEANASGVESDSEHSQNGHQDVASDSNGSELRRRKQSESPDDSPSPLQQHLLILADQQPKFLHLLPPTISTDEAWAVDFRSIAHQLVISTLFDIVTNRFGHHSARLVRILHQKGKLDEKTLTTLALINQKNMRALLTAMNQAGFLELQEIPRGNDRTPGKTIFLWFFDEERCRHRLLDETQKAMTRVLQRIGVEREKVEATVQKSERTDVRGNEEKFMREPELKVLHDWRAKEERLLGELGRLDDLVAVLRDFF